MKGRMKKKEKEEKEPNRPVLRSFQEIMDDKHPSNHQSHNHTHHTLHTIPHTNTSSNFQSNPITLPLNSNASNYRFYGIRYISKSCFRCSPILRTPLYLCSPPFKLQYVMRSHLRRARNNTRMYYISPHAP